MYSAYDAVKQQRLSWRRTVACAANAASLSAKSESVTRSEHGCGLSPTHNAMLVSTPPTHRILPQQVHRYGQKHDILHEERGVDRHRRETARGCLPAIGDEGDN